MRVCDFCLPEAVRITQARITGNLRIDPKKQPLPITEEFRICEICKLLGFKTDATWTITPSSG